MVLSVSWLALSRSVLCRQGATGSVCLMPPHAALSVILTAASRSCARRDRICRWRRSQTSGASRDGALRTRSRQSASGKSTYVAHCRARRLATRSASGLTTIRRRSVHARRLPPADAPGIDMVLIRIVPALGTDQRSVLPTPIDVDPGVLRRGGGNPVRPCRGRENADHSGRAHAEEEGFHGRAPVTDGHVANSHQPGRFRCRPTNRRGGRRVPCLRRVTHPSWSGRPAGR